jgi:hypothetical protein
MDKYKIKSDILKEILDDAPDKKREVKAALGFTRSTFSRALSGKRAWEAGELLTASEIVGVSPFALAEKDCELCTNE